MHGWRSHCPCPPLTHECARAAPYGSHSAGTFWQDAITGLPAAWFICAVERVAIRSFAVICIQWSMRGNDACQCHIDGQPACQGSARQGSSGLREAGPWEGHACWAASPAVAHGEIPCPPGCMRLTNRIGIVEDVAVLHRASGGKGGMHPSWAAGGAVRSMPNLIWALPHIL